MGVKHYLWRAVDHEGEGLERFVTKRRDKKAALNRRSAKRISSGNRCAYMARRRRSSRIDWPHTAPRSRAWALSTSARSAGGSITALRIPTSHSDDGSGRCFASGRCEPEVRGAKFAEIRRGSRLDPQPIRFADLRFNQERHLSSRPTFKERRAAALTEWRQLFAA